VNNFEIKKPFVVDVSSWEDKQDWGKCDPVPEIAIARATYGLKFVDRTLAHNWNEWRMNGIRKSAYGFLLPGFSADDQAKYFVDAMKEVGGFDEFDLPPVMDFEQAGFSAHQLKVWLDRVEGEFGKKPIIYTRADIWETVGQPSWMNDYPFWLGWYPFTDYIDKNDTIPASRMPAGLNRWALWQYSEAGRLDFDPYNGYDFNVIADWYYDSLDGIEPEPPIEEPLTDIVTGKITSLRGMLMRKGPNTSFESYGGIWYGKEVNGKLINDGNDTWMKLEDAYVAVNHNGNEYIKTDTNPAPEPPLSGRRLFRVLHDQEMGDLWRVGMPEVMIFSDADVVKATKEIQEMMYALFEHGTPDFTKDWRINRFESVYRSGRAFMNGKGMDQNANYITGERLDGELPKFDKARVCGGATISGEVIGNMLKVETLRDAVPLDYLLERPWLYFEAVASGNNITPFPQVIDIENDIYGKAYIPLISKGDVYFPLSELEEVSEIADPYRT